MSGLFFFSDIKVGLCWLSSNAVLDLAWCFRCNNIRPTLQTYEYYVATTI